jgi:hypothetical protein
LFVPQLQLPLFPLLQLFVLLRPPLIKHTVSEPKNVIEPSLQLQPPLIEHMDFLRFEVVLWRKLRVCAPQSAELVVICGGLSAICQQHVGITVGTAASASLWSIPLTVYTLLVV